MPKVPTDSPSQSPTPEERPDALKNVTATLELVTPEKAATWLKASPDYNRGIGLAVVARYTSAMKEDRWFFTGEPVIFNNSDGESVKDLLQDGWHRLTAIAESGKGQWMIIVRGVNKDAFHYIDHGRNRSFRDTLTVLKIPHAQFCSTSVSYVTGYFKHGRFTTHSLEDHERWQTYLAHGPKLEALQEQYNKRLPLRGVQPGLLCAVHYVLSLKDAEAADEFMELIVHGDELEPDHPVAQFRSLVRKINGMDKLPYNLPVKYGATLIKTWNLFRKGEKVKGKFNIPSITPEIE
jgi:hypothetical protein